MVPRSAGRGCADASRFKLTHNRLVDDLDELAHRDPCFAQALSGVWWWADAAGPEVTARLGRWIPTLRAGFLPFKWR